MYVAWVGAMFKLLLEETRVQEVLSSNLTRWNFYTLICGKNFTYGLFENDRNYTKTRPGMAHLNKHCMLLSQC